MTDQDPDTGPPSIITPMESGYIRAMLPAILPVVNYLLDATNLDTALHITAVTQDQLWKGLNGILTLVSIVLVITKRIREGKDPHSTAPRIVMSKPDQPAPPIPPKDDFADIAKATPTVPGQPHMTDEELLGLIQKRMKNPQKPVAGERS